MYLSMKKFPNIDLPSFPLPYNLNIYSKNYSKFQLACLIKWGKYTF